MVLWACCAVCSPHCAEVDVVQEALVAIFLLLHEESDSSSAAMQSFLGAGGRAALAAAQDRSPPLPVETMEWVDSIARNLPPETDAEVLQTLEPEPEPELEVAEPEILTQEQEPEPEPEAQWSAEQQSTGNGRHLPVLK